MEPLSAVASAIALAQATEKLLKLAKVAKSVGDIPAEYLKLLEELEFVKALAKNVDDHIQCHDATDVHLLRTVSQKLDGSAKSLETISEAVERSSRLSNGKITRGQTKVSTVRWQMNQSDIAHTRQDISQAKDNLTLCLQLLVSRQVAVSNQQFSEMKQIMLAVHGHIAQPSTSGPADSINPPQPAFTNSQDRICDSSDPERSFYCPLPGPGGAGPYCDLLCPCNCHDMPATQPFFWVECLLGSLIINKNFKLFSKEPCDVSTCKLPSPLLAKVRYTSPSWTIRRAVEASMSWGVLGGAGVNLHLRVPRVIIWKPFQLIGDGDVIGLGQELATGKIMPADVNPNGRPLLAYALWCLNTPKIQTEMVRMLFDFGCDLTISGPRNPSAIILARMKLRGGWELQDPALHSIHHKVAYGGTTAKNEPIRLNGVLRCFFTGDDEKLEAILNNCKEDINYLDECGFGAIHYAVLLNRTRALKSLLSKGANPNLLTGNGSSPLMFAVHAKVSAKSLHILLRCGAEANSRSTGKCEEALIMRTLGQPEKMRLLLDCGASAHDQATWSETPLHFYEGRGIVPYHVEDKRSAEEAIEQSIRLLEAQGVDMDYQNSWGITPLLAAVAREDIHAIRVLMRLGARVDVPTHGGITILHVAAWGRNRAIFDTLRAYDLSSIDAEKRDWKGLRTRDVPASRTQPWRELLTTEEMNIFFDELWKIRAAKFLPSPFCLF